jgi:hypothetical protein
MHGTASCIQTRRSITTRTRYTPVRLSPLKWCRSPREAFLLSLLRLLQTFVCSSVRLFVCSSVRLSQKGLVLFLAKSLAQTAAVPPSLDQATTDIAISAPSQESQWHTSSPPPNSSDSSHRKPCLGRIWSRVSRDGLLENVPQSKNLFVSCIRD